MRICAISAKEHMDKIIARAPAKINLALEVAPLGAGEDKHRLDSVFCTTTLADTLIFSFTSDKEPFNVAIEIESTDFDVSYIKPTDNTLIKVVEQFTYEYGIDALPFGTLGVRLVKSIPAQAGLGGGSSDAAAMLRMLCWLGQVEPLSERSLAVARAVGADVPFFLHAPKTGLCARMGGYGDELKEVLPKPKLSLVLVKPQRGISTKRAFSTFDREGPSLSNLNAVESFATALKTCKNASELAKRCNNNLESAAMRLLPTIATLKEEMQRCAGVLCAMLAGSGSVVFGICENTEASQVCMQHFAGKGYWAVCALT